MLNELPENEEISFFKQGEYLEMCAGPHITCTGEVKAFKLLSVAGAYWRGDEKNKMLTRIYGTSFPSESMLKEYLNRLEEAKKGTTENWAKSWAYSHYLMKDRDSLFSFRKE